jgi:hypothetical protein
MIHCPPLSVTKEIIEIALVNFKSALILYLGPARNLSRERCNERRYSKHSSEKKQETDGKRIEEDLLRLHSGQLKRAQNF